jgi:hypothetical protein
MTNIEEKSILIVDDAAAVLRALKKVLSGEGAVVESASWAGLRYIMNKAMRDAVGGGRDQRFKAARPRFDANGSFERKLRCGCPVQPRSFGRTSGRLASAISNGRSIAVVARGAKRIARKMMAG